MKNPANINDRRYCKTHEIIRETAFSLAEKGGWKKVSVTELTKKANINRNTFYLHYETIEDVYCEIEGEVADIYHIYLEETPYEKMFGNYSSFESFLNRIKEKTMIIEKCGRTDFLMIKLQEEWVDFFENKYLDGSLPEKDRMLYTSYLSGAMFVFFSKWIKDPENTSVKEHFHIGSRLLRYLKEISES